MVFLFKLCLALVTIAGIGAAVAVPVVSSVSKSPKGNTSARSGVNLDQTSLEGSTFSVEKCSYPLSTDDGSLISFGSEGVTRICGGIDNLNQLQLEQEQVTQVLKNTGGTPLSWSNLDTLGIRSYCENTSTSAEDGSTEIDTSSDRERDLITLGTSNNQVCNGREYLKLHSSSDSFLKRQKETGGQGKIGFCDKDCGKGDRTFSETSQTQSLQENLDKGKELNFHKLTI